MVNARDLVIDGSRRNTPARSIAASVPAFSQNVCGGAEKRYLQVPLMASILYRLLAERLPDNYRRAQAKTVFRHLLDVGGKLDIEERDVIVTLDKRAHNPILAETDLIHRPTPMPWFAGRKLIVRLP